MTADIRYPIAERFKAPQGEGLYSGVPMAFMRLIGCSVGQKVCTACDTDFSTMSQALGGGMYTAEELRAWAGAYEHVCITGGEPLDRDLRRLLSAMAFGPMPHIETSGTRRPDWLGGKVVGRQGYHYVANKSTGHALVTRLWLTVSPKPGYLENMVRQADEVKVILGGLGDGPGWPTLEDAARWASEGKLVYVQPRNLRREVDRAALRRALEAVDTHPGLRLSVQLHKFLETR